MTSVEILHDIGSAMLGGVGVLSIVLGAMMLLARRRDAWVDRPSAVLPTVRVLAGVVILAGVLALAAWVFDAEVGLF